MTQNSFTRFLFRCIRKNETKLHELSYLFWECTLRCNLQCRHCGSDCTADNKISDMPFNDFLQAILPLKKVYKKNSIMVAISGGEPLLRDDLPQCGRLLTEHGFRWGIVTNGYNYTPLIQERLLAAGMGSITVSLDGFAQAHNWLRGNDQSFDRAIAALELIDSSNRLVYDAVTCVNQKNISELEGLKELLIGRHVKAWRLFTISPIGRAAHDESLHLTQEQLRYLMDFIERSRIEKRINVTFCCESWLGEYELRVRKSYFFCRAGIHIASVLNDGSISACPNINRNFVQGNIYSDNFIDVWNNRFELMRDRRWTKTGICTDCSEYKNCNGGAMHLWNEKKDGIMTCLYERITNEELRIKN